MKPLTASQGRRADLHAAIPHKAAGHLAGLFGRRHHDDLLSLCLLQFILIVRRFKPNLTSKGESGFGAFAMMNLKREVARKFARELRRGAWVTLDAAPVPSSPAACCPVEADEAWAMLVRLPPTQAAVMRAWCRGEALRDIGSSRGNRSGSGAAFNAKAKALKRLRWMYAEDYA